MSEQAFRIDPAHGRCTTEFDYAAETSWFLFLKYIEGLEQKKQTKSPWTAGARTTSLTATSPVDWAKRETRADIVSLR